MLLIVRKEEKAFWLLDVIVGKLLPGIFFFIVSTLRYNRKKDISSVVLQEQRL